MKLVRPFEITPTTLTDINIDETNTGLSNWLPGTTYSIGQKVTRIDPSGFGRGYLVYESLQNSNTGNNPDSSPSWWLKLTRVYQEWSNLTTYSAGDKVIDATAHRLYESLQGSNFNKALVNEEWWLDLGPTNPWQMFDQSNTTASTVHGGPIDFTVDVTGKADSVALLNVLADEVQIIVTASAVEVYNQTHTLVSYPGENEWYDYYFEGLTNPVDLVITDLPLDDDPAIQVIVTRATGDISIGTAVVGLSRDLGVTTYGARVGIQDFSRKVQDDFGNYTVVQRNFAKRATFKVVTDNTKTDFIVQLLAAYRATPIVYVGSDLFSSTYVYGFYRDFAVEIVVADKSYLTIEIEGLT